MIINSTMKYVRPNFVDHIVRTRYAVFICAIYSEVCYLLGAAIATTCFFLALFLFLIKFCNHVLSHIDTLVIHFNEIREWHIMYVYRSKHVLKNS